MTAPRSCPSLPFLSFVCAAALTVSACGNNDTAPPTAAAPPPPAQEAADVPDGAPVIDQVSLQFVPAELVVTLGEDIYFTNSESTPHTVTLNGENVSGAMGEGGIVVWTPSEPGTYRVTCDFHRYMEATITVTRD